MLRSRSLPRHFVLVSFGVFLAFILGAGLLATVPGQADAKSTYTTSNTVSAAKTGPSVKYSVHVLKGSWKGWKKDGKKAAAPGAKRVDGVKIQLANSAYKGSVKYRVNIQGKGWTGWKQDGQAASSSSNSKRLQAIKVKLTDELAKQYDVWYRVRAEEFGWMGWTKNGGVAGTVGYGCGVKAIQVKLTPKDVKAPGNTERAYRDFGGYDDVTIGDTGKVIKIEAYGKNKLVPGLTAQGTYDDYAIKAAVEGNQNKKVTLLFESGKHYYVSWSILLYDNMTIKATGATIEQTKYARGKALLANAYASKTMNANLRKGGGYSRFKNVKVIGGTWITTGKPSPDAGAGKFEGYKRGYTNMFLGHGRNAIVKDATFVNNYNAHCIELAGVRDVTIHNCTFKGKYVGDSGNECVQFETCSTERNVGSGGPYDGTSCLDVSIQKCKFKMAMFPGGIGMNNDSVKHKYQRIKIMGNTINAKSFAIAVKEANHVVLKGNKIKHGDIVVYNSEDVRR